MRMTRNDVPRRRADSTAGVVGPAPFHGRFKAILVEAEPQTLELTRNVHFNPVRAKLALRAEVFAWSG